MNYSALASAIKGYAENEFLITAGSFSSTDQINTFIQQAERRIYNMVQIPALRKNVTGALTASNQYLTLPLDWLADYSLAVILPTGNYEYMLNKDVNFIREAFPFPAVSGTPTHYAIFDANTLIVGPTPNSGYAVELHYFYYPESIVTANNTWLGDNFDSVLLYGSLLEAAAFMKSEADTITNYTNRYNEAMAQLKQLGDGKNRQDAYRSGQARYPVT
jgi:hypothetical protein